MRDVRLLFIKLSREAIIKEILIHISLKTVDVKEKVNVKRTERPCVVVIPDGFRLDVGEETRTIIWHSF